MKAVGAAVDPQKVQKTMMEFTKENEKQNLVAEMMDDAIENAMDTEETEDETSELMDQVRLKSLLVIVLLSKTFTYIAETS